MGKILTDATGQNILGALQTQNSYLANLQGFLSLLNTDNKTNFVSAINEIHNETTLINNTINRLKLKTTTSDLREISNYIPEEGEATFETDTGKLYIGNGINKLSELLYIGEID